MNQTVRNILGVIVGFIGYFVALFLLLTISYNVLGVSGVFLPGNYDASIIWSIGSLIGNLIAAFIGGFVCALVAGSARAALWLGAVIFLLGVISAIVVLAVPMEQMARSGESVAMMDSISKIREPFWSPLINGIAALFAAAFGGKLKKDA